MPDTFHELYNGLTKAVFLEHVRQELVQGADGLACAKAHAEQGKIDFALAHLLLSDAADDVKRDMLAYAYERRALLSDERAENFSRQHHRSFPLIKLEAQKDRLAARQVRQGKPVLQRGTMPNIT